jgi:catalase (peroxidase I)
VSLLNPLAHVFVPKLLSTADLWVLAANVSIELMGGPKVPTKIGRIDSLSCTESVKDQCGRFPDGDKGADHLREIFEPKGFNDEDIVALSGAHTLGECHLENSGFKGPWTQDPNAFDNSFFQNLLDLEYIEDENENGNV